MTPARLFVYGTLMPGQARWPSLRPYAASWVPATVPGRLWDTGRGYPAARFSGEGGRVPGVLVALVPGMVADALATMDHVEEEGVLYRRVEVVTSGGPAVAYDWLGPTEGFLALPDGWPARRSGHDRHGRARFEAAGF